MRGFLYHLCGCSRACPQPSFPQDDLTDRQVSNPCALPPLVKLCDRLASHLERHRTSLLWQHSWNGRTLAEWSGVRTFQTYGLFSNCVRLSVKARALCLSLRLNKSEKPRSRPWLQFCEFLRIDKLDASSPDDLISHLLF